MSRHAHRFALGGILVVGLVLRVWSWIGPELSDEIRYAAVAKNMANGYLPAGPTEWFGTRVGLIAPVAALFRLAGASDLTLALWPLIGSLGAIVVAYLIGRDLASINVGLIAAAIVAAAPIEARLGMFLRPDAILPAFIGLSVWCALRAARSETRVAAWAVGAGAAFTFAWSIRESALLMAPIVITAAWPAIRRAIIPGIAGALSVPALTCVAWALAGGGFFAPLRSAGSELEYRNPLTAWDLQESYLWQLGRAALTPSRLLFLALPAVLAAIAVHVARRERRAVLPMIWLGWAFLYLEFGTLLNVGKPYRYLTLCVIPAAVLVALALEGRYAWLPIVATVVIGTYVLAGLPFRQYKRDDVVLFSRVAGKLARLPSGHVATESYTWWKKFTIYRATTRLSVPRARDPAFSTPAQLAESRRLRPLPTVAEATYLVTGPVHRLRSWPSNWTDYTATLPATTDLELIDQVGRAAIWRLPAATVSPAP